MGDLRIFLVLSDIIKYNWIIILIVLYFLIKVYLISLLVRKIIKNGNPLIKMRKQK